MNPSEPVVGEIDGAGGRVVAGLVGVVELVLDPPDSALIEAQVEHGVGVGRKVKHVLGVGISGGKSQ